MALENEASPICRGKNLSWETVMLFYNYMPKAPLPKDQFNQFVETNINGWTQTHSQIARQLAFYYEENGICYPRFGEKSTLADLFAYMVHWGHNYFVPNPYAPSLKDKSPKCIYKYLADCIKLGETDFHSSLDAMFNKKLSSHDKVKVYLSNFTNIMFMDGEMQLNHHLKDEVTILSPSLDATLSPKAYFNYFNYHQDRITTSFSSYRTYISAIKSKPFLLLAGISGTGKSRIVRELARACWDVDSEEYKAPKPRNFEMVQVKPNWHDSSELIGYVSRIDGEKFVMGPFLKFMVRAMQESDVPYFLCLDEMNLAPVEQYFAEYLSVVESRKSDEEGNVVTDPILEYENTEAYYSLLGQLGLDDAEYKNGTKKLSIPQNLIVVGTVNMDETTFSFSRKVLDRAMTIEMNEVDLKGGLTQRHEQIGKLGKAELIGNAVEGVDVYEANKDVCDKVIAYLQAVNDKLEGTPFKIAYRTRNEFLLYVVNNLPYNKNEEGEELDDDFVIARALDEITSMKVLSRIEGDESKVSSAFLKTLSTTIKTQLEAIFAEPFGTKDSEDEHKSISLAKLEEMEKRLTSGYTSFWS